MKLIFCLFLMAFGSNTFAQTAAERRAMGLNNDGTFSQSIPKIQGTIEPFSPQTPATQTYASSTPLTSVQLASRSSTLMGGGSNEGVTLRETHIETVPNGFAYRFYMQQNGRNQTADDFEAWMKAKGIRVLKRKDH